MERWKEDFIIGLRQGKTPDMCARLLAGMPLAAVYAAREEDPVFAAAWDEAAPLEDASDRTVWRPLTPAALEAILWSQCSDEEAAAYFGMEVGEFKAAIAGDETLARTYKLAPMGGKAVLKRSQFERAAGGDGSMQVWLGKQHLGQSDKVDNTTTVRHELDDKALARGLLYILAEGGIDAREVIEGEVVHDLPLSITGGSDDSSA